MKRDEKVEVYDFYSASDHLKVAAQLIGKYYPQFAHDVKLKGDYCEKRAKRLESQVGTEHISDALDALPMPNDPSNSVRKALREDRDNASGG